MKKSKKVLALALAAVMAVSTFAGCGGSADETTTAPTTTNGGSTNPTTAAPTAAPVITTAAASSSPVTVMGDANCDEAVTMADAAAIYQSIGNSDKYSLSKQGAANADCCNPGSGITAADALAVQKYSAKLITSLPVEE